MNRSDCRIYQQVERMGLPVAVAAAGTSGARAGGAGRRASFTAISAPTPAAGGVAASDQVKHALDDLKLLGFSVRW